MEDSQNVMERTLGGKGRLFKDLLRNVLDESFVSISCSQDSVPEEIWPIIKQDYESNK